MVHSSVLACVSRECPVFGPVRIFHGEPVAPHASERRMLVSFRDGTARVVLKVEDMLDGTWRVTPHPSQGAPHVVCLEWMAAVKGVEFI
jgi:hypothetical protein